jgi:hypothetical protein
MRKGEGGRRGGEGGRGGGKGRGGREKKKEGRKERKKERKKERERERRERERERKKTVTIKRILPLTPLVAFIFFFNFYFLCPMSVFTMSEDNLEDWLFPSMWILGIKLRLSELTAAFSL